VDFLRRGETIDCLKTGWKWPELRDRLTIFVIVEIMTEAHSFRSQVGIGSESDSLSGVLNKILETSDLEVGLRTEKSRGEGEMS